MTFLWRPKDADVIGNGVDPDPTAPFPGSAFFCFDLSVPIL